MTGVHVGASVVLTRQHLEDVVEDLFYGHDYVVFDVETKGQYRLDPRRNDVFWMVLAGKGGFSEVIPFGHPIGNHQTGVDYDHRMCADGKVRKYKRPVWDAPPVQLSRADVLSACKPLFYSKDHVKVNHNIKFDVLSLSKHYGEIPPGPYADTQVMAWLLNENLHQYSLESLVKRQWGRELDKSISSAVEIYPFDTAALYTHFDGRYTEMLYRLLLPKIHAEGLDGVFRLDMDMLEALCQMETVGMPFDRAAAEVFDAELDIELAQMRTDLYRLAGRQWNFASPVDRVEVFYGKKKDGGQGLKPAKLTKTGAPSCDGEALSAHEGNPLVDRYAEYGDIAKLSSTYVKAYLGTQDKKVVDKKKNQAPVIGDDGRIHTNYKLASTVTGRISASEPNTQQIPRADTDKGRKVRSMFVAPPGDILLCADYQQIEYMVLAHFSRDPRLIDFFVRGLDFHLAVAALILKKPLDEVTPKERTMAKTASFLTVYGGGDARAAVVAGVSLQAAKEFRAAHRAMLPQVYQFCDEVVRTARTHKPPYVKTLLGRKRRLPEMFYSDSGIRAKAERQGVNAQIQGTAAEINKMGVVRYHQEAGPGQHLLANVHDEFVTSVRTDSEAEGRELLQWAMTGPGLGDILDVPLKADIKAVSRWSDFK